VGNYVDFISSFEQGVKSGVAPLILQKNQASFSLNSSIRGGFIKNRPPIFQKTLNYNGNLALQLLVEGGFYQGGGYYRPDFGTESLLAQIAGHLIKFTENGSVWNVTDVSVPGDLNDPTVSQVWMWQSEKWMIITDGSSKLPIFFDGTSSRRSYGASVVLDTTVASGNFPNPRVIGEIISVNLSSPWTAPFDVPVIFNKEFYQPTLHPGFYTVVLKPINATTGSTVPAGSDIVIVESNVGYTLHSRNVQNGVVAGQASVDLEFTTPVSLNVGDQVIIPGLTNPYQLVQIFNNPPSIFYRFASTGGGFPDSGKSVPAGTLIQKASSSSPSVTVTTTFADFVVPANGSSITVEVTIPYFGNPNLSVYIGNDLYSISQPPPAPNPTTIFLINLSDLANAGAAIPTGTPLGEILSVPELPAGRMGAYGMERNWMSLTDGISYIAGDIVGGASGTPANNYRDAVLKTTENDFLSAGGSFRLPGAGDIITAMVFPPTLDTSLGQGALIIFTPFTAFSNNSPVDRAVWTTLTSPLQTKALDGSGALGQNSTVLINSDTFFRSYSGIGSLVMARRDFGGWGNKPISNEMQRTLKNDNLSLLPYGSAMGFDNRYLSTCAPNVSARGVFHIGMISLNNDLLSSLRANLPPSWESVWTGINALQVISGRVNGTLRAFAFTFDIDRDKIELYEFLREQTSEYLDNGVTPIQWLFESPVLFNKDVKPLTELVNLEDGEVYLSDIKGTVSVKVFYRPDFYPCWTSWHEFNLCADNVGTNKQPGYRMRVGLGSPDPTDCELGNNRPLMNGYFFQFRIEITGACTFHGMRCKASTVPTPAFAPVECDPADCQLIDCVVPNDLRIYSLQGLPPEPLPPVVTPPLVVSNEVVYFNHACDSDTTLVYYGILPTWITLDQTNQRLIGAANTFWGATQDEANANAQTALDAFGNVALGSGALVCFTCGSTATTPAALIWVHAGNGQGTDIAASGADIAMQIPNVNPVNSEVTQTSAICNPTAAAKTLRVTSGISGGQQGTIAFTLNDVLLFNVGTLPTVSPPPFGTFVFADFTIPPFSVLPLVFKLKCNDHCNVAGIGYTLSIV
jgi:hypothetical protein